MNDVEKLKMLEEMAKDTSYMCDCLRNLNEAISQDNNKIKDICIKKILEKTTLNQHKVLQLLIEIMTKDLK